MRSFTLAAILALLGQSSEAFVASPSGRTAFLPTCAKQQHQPLSVSTELTSEASVGQSSEAEDNEGISNETPAIVGDDLPSVTEETATVVETATEETSASTEETPAERPKRIERVRHTLFLGNLPFETDEATVREIMSEYGEVLMISLPRSKETGQPRGFAFVDMSTAEEMESAIEGANGRLVDGRVLRASPSLPKDKQPKRTDADNGMGKVYVGNISYDTSKESLVEHFEQYGTVFEVYMPTDVDNRSRGYAFVTLKKEELDGVIENANGSAMDGRDISVTLPLPRGQKPPRREQKEALTKIYVGNLSFYTVQETLEEVFSEFGTIRDCYIPPDPQTGGSRGFGFVTMDPEDAQRAIAELDSCELDGRIIRVNEAQPKGTRRPANNNFEDESYDDTPIDE